MSLTQGVDFRATAGFVTDPTNFTVELGNAFNPTYPTVLSPSGVNGGWEDAVPGSRDRTAFTGAAASLSGIHFVQSGSARYRIDLPSSGTYNVQAAFGDNAVAQGPFTATFQDTTTVLSTPVNNVSTSGADEFYDATGVQRTSHTDWVTNNAAKSLTFSTTIFRTVITFSGGGPIATLFVQSAGGGFTPKARRTLSARVGSRIAA